MKIKIIRSETDYDAALKRLDKIFDEPKDSKLGDEAEILGLLIENYEKKHYPIDPPDPVETIRIRMEEMQLKHRDLAEIFGGKNRVSEVLNRKRKLTLEMIRKVNSLLHISPEILIREYSLSDHQ